MIFCLFEVAPSMIKSRKYDNENNSLCTDHNNIKACGLINEVECGRS